MINHSYAQRFDENFLALIPEGNLKLTQQGASHFASLALKCIQQEFPNILGHVMAQADGDHWLASFAVFVLSKQDDRDRLLQRKTRSP